MEHLQYLPDNINLYYDQFVIAVLFILVVINAIMGGLNIYLIYLRKRGKRFAKWSFITLIILDVIIITGILILRQLMTGGF
jgi:hypothetical protein